MRGCCRHILIRAAAVIAPRRVAGDQSGDNWCSYVISEIEPLAPCRRRVVPTHVAVAVVWPPTVRESQYNLLDDADAEVRQRIVMYGR